MDFIEQTRVEGRGRWVSVFLEAHRGQDVFIKAPDFRSAVDFV